MPSLSQRTRAGRPPARSPAYQLGRGPSPNAETEDDARRARTAVRRFTDLEREIDALPAFPRLKASLMRLCVEDEMPDAGAFIHVRRALGLLAKPLGVHSRTRAPTRPGN